jgi:hypothetical protein
MPAHGAAAQLRDAGAHQDVAARERNGDALLLDGAGGLEALLVDAHEQLALEEVVLEAVALGRGHILRLIAVVLGRESKLALPIISSRGCDGRHSGWATRDADVRPASVWAGWRGHGRAV